MTLQLEGQLDLFDMLADLEPKPEPPNVADLTGWTFFETDPDKLDAIHLAWGKAHEGVSWQDWRRFPGWHESLTGRNGLGGLHPSFTYTADLSCHHAWRATVSQREAGNCQCVGRIDQLYRVYCSGCDWWTAPANSENGAAEAYLDHCWPGWRELPVLESRMKNYDYLFTYPDDYPPDFKTSGSPIRDCRGQTNHATRHVPGGSPFGGYKTAVVQDCEKH